MSLEFAIEVERDLEEAAFWWCCGNEACLIADRRDWIPAPEYDFEYLYQDIPIEDLADDPELRAEYDEAQKRYLERGR